MFTETSTISEVTILPLEGNIQVKWRNTIEKDGVVVSANDHYRVYSADQKTEFESEVEGAAQYVSAVGW